jgi:hypothetical protein
MSVLLRCNSVGLALFAKNRNPYESENDKPALEAGEELVSIRALTRLTPPPWPRLSGRN